MTNQPPFELIQQWVIEIDYDERNWLYEINIANRAAQWGADQELEACCEYLTSRAAWDSVDVQVLFNHRRPKLPSLKEQALEALEVEDDAMPLRSLERSERFDTIRRALEALPDE